MNDLAEKALQGLNAARREVVGRPMLTFAALMFAAVIALVLLWLGVVAFVRRSDQPEVRVWWVATAWALPFVVGPPLMGTSVQSYVAYGLLQRHGLSPYDYAPNRLGSDQIVTAIEPGARG